MDPAAGDIAGQVDIVDFLVAHPDIGLAVVHQQSCLGHQAHEQATLDAYQHDGKHHAQQGREKLAAIGHQGS